MSDIQAVIAAYTGPRTIPVDQIPDIPRDATEDELRMLQLAMGQTAIAVKTVLNHVGMTDATKPADAAKTLALWERHEQTVAPTQSPFDPPLLELEHADMDPALIRWFMADHMDWTIKSRWCFTRTHDAGLATLSIDATNAEGEPVRFHVVFNLWFPLHAEVARRIDVTHGLGLTIPPLRKPARPVPTAGGGVMEPYGGIVIRLSTLVLDAMLCDPALSDLYERTSSAEDVWNEVTRPTAYDWWAGEVLRATPPIRPELHSQGGVPAMYLGRVKGIGQIVLSSDPFLQPYDRHDWLPIAGRCHLHALARPELSMAWPLIKDKPGWSSTSIVCVAETLAGPAFAWELTLQYRRQKDVPLDELLERVGLAALNPERHDPDGPKAGMVPPIWAFLIWLLFSRGMSADQLTAGMALYGIVQPLLDTFILGWMDLLGALKARQQGRNPDTLEIDPAGRRVMAMAHTILQDTTGNGLTPYLAQPTEGQMLAIMQVLHNLRATWMHPAVRDAFLGLISTDAEELLVVSTATLTMSGLNALLLPHTEHFQVHPAADDSDATDLARSVHAATWWWLQELTIRAATDVPRMTQAESDWLRGPVGAAIFSPIPAYRNPDGGTATEEWKQGVMTLCENLLKTPVSRPVVGYYRPKLTLTERWQAISTVGINELRVVAKPDGCWLAYGPADSYPVILPWTPGPSPRNDWRLVVPERLGWELHLVMTAWYVDMGRAGVAAVMGERTRTIASQDALGGLERSGKQKAGRQSGPSTLYVPRKHAKDKPKPALTVHEGDYGDQQDHAAIARRLLSEHGVRAHPFVRADVTWKVRELQMRAWEQLDFATRMDVLYGDTPLTLDTDLTLDYPAQGIIRGMKVMEAEDGTLTVALGYRRGGKDKPADGAIEARPVVCKSLEASELLLKILAERETAAEVLHERAA